MAQPQRGVGEGWPIGFRSGFIRDVEWVEAPAQAPTRYTGPHGINLNAMARRALAATLKSLAPVAGGDWYRPTGWNNAFVCPLALGFEYSEYAEQPGRCGLALYWLRQATGSREGEAKEAAMYRLAAHHVRGGLPAQPTIEAHDQVMRGKLPGVTDENDLPHAVDLGFAVPLLMEAWIVRYAETQDSQLRRLIESAVATLKRIATRDESGYAYYPYAYFTFDEAGRPQWDAKTWVFPYTAASLLNAMARWAQITQDAEDMAFVRALADGVLAGLSAGDPEMRRAGLLPVALVRGKGNPVFHSLAMMTRARGMILAGIVTGNRRYVDWGKEYYDIMLRRNSDSGWFSEHFPASGMRAGDPRPHNETCVTADMVDIAAMLAENGYPDYWDHVERYVRNYLAASQLTMDGPFEALYRRVNSGKDPATVEKGLADAKAQWTGAFPGLVRMNDLVLGSTETLTLDMEGCCNWGGSRAVGRACAGVVTAKGASFHVNMAFDADTSPCQVISSLPVQGRVTVIPKVEGDFHLRPPAWAPRMKVKASRDGALEAARWEGAYVCFAGAKAGQRLDITYPLAHFVQSTTIFGTGKPYDFKLEWLGNTVIGLEPRGEYLPLYQDRREILAAAGLQSLLNHSGK